MLLHMECLEEFDWHDTSERLCDLFWKFYEEAVVHRDLSAEQISDFVKFFSICPSDQLHDNVIKMQGTITLSIISGMPRLSLIKASVKVMDIIYWINQTFKTAEDRIKKEEFHNDAINNNIELRDMMIKWAKRA